MIDSSYLPPLGLIGVVVFLSTISGFAGYAVSIERKNLKPSWYVAFIYIAVSVAAGVFAMYLGLWVDKIPDDAIPLLVMVFSFTGKDMLSSSHQILTDAITNRLRKMT